MACSRPAGAMSTIASPSTSGLICWAAAGPVVFSTVRCPVAKIWIRKQVNSSTGRTGIAGFEIKTHMSLNSLHSRRSPEHRPSRTE